MLRRQPIGPWLVLALAVAVEIANAQKVRPLTVAGCCGHAATKGMLGQCGEKDVNCMPHIP